MQQREQNSASGPEPEKITRRDHGHSITRQYTFYKNYCAHSQQDSDQRKLD